MNYRVLEKEGTRRGGRGEDEGERDEEE